MSKLREAALAALKELDYIEQTGDISTGSHIDVAQKLRVALAEDRLNEMSDGYHTFAELYEFRKAYNAALFNEWAAANKYSVHKSWRHHDGKLCFGGGWFIVVAMLPQGQISNHYEEKDWDLFCVPFEPLCLFEFDGHSGADVIARLTALGEVKE